MKDTIFCSIDLWALQVPQWRFSQPDLGDVHVPGAMENVSIQGYPSGVLSKEDDDPGGDGENFAVGGGDYPLADRDRSWDRTAAESRLRAWAGAEDAPNAKYAKCFMWHDGKNGDQFTAYKLPFVDIVAGEPQAIPKALFAIAGALGGARSGLNIPAADKATLKTKLSAWYAKMRKEFGDESLVPKWEQEQRHRKPEGRFTVQGYPIGVVAKEDGDGGGSGMGDDNFAAGVPDSAEGDENDAGAEADDDADDMADCPCPKSLTIPLLPQGNFEHELYGPLSWTPAKFAQMQENFDRGVTGYCPSLNYDHAGENPFAGEKPAAGWFSGLQPVDGKGLFGHVDLTPRARKAIADGEYRYISAEVSPIYTNSQGQTFANVIGGGALTNKPFHDTMPGLFSRDGEIGPTRVLPRVYCFAQAGPHRFYRVAAQDAAGAAAGRKEQDMSLFDALRKKLGFAETATEDEVAEKVAAALETQTVAGQQFTQPPPVTPPAVATPPAGAGTTPDPQVQALTLQLAAVHTQLQDFAKRQEATEAREVAEREARKKVEAGIAVQTYMRQGKIAPSMRESAEALALSQPDLFKQLYESSPRLIDYAPLGLGGEDGEGSGATETFAGAVNAYAQQHGCGIVDAQAAVGTAQPELYEQHRRRMLQHSPEEQA